MATSAPATATQITSRQAFLRKAKKQLEDGDRGLPDTSVQAWALIDIAESLAEIKNLLEIIANKPRL